MKYLLPGGESQARFDLLLSLSKITSENLISALEDHLVKGMPDSHAALINGVAKGNFSRSLTRLNKVAKTVEKIKELDWQKIVIS